MGFFSGITETLFGDQGEGAAESQAEQNIADRQFIAEQVAQARGDVLPLFDASAQARQQGTQGALNVLGGALPAQLDVFQQGNVGAQQALLGGDFTPQSLTVQPQFLQTLQDSLTLPQFTPPTQVIEQGDTQRRSSLLGGFNTDLDLFRAAGAGNIPGISQFDQRFFAEAAKNKARSAPLGTRFIDNPQSRDFIGQQGGFNTSNELRLANLLDQLI